MHGSNPASQRSAKSARLQVKGALHGDSLYIERAADAELESALQAGEYCYVLAPRQIGKSSLRLHAARALAGRGILCVHIDLNLLGGHDDRDPLSGWYFSFISTIAAQLGLGDALAFWQSCGDGLPVFHLTRYLREEVLTRLTAPIVIFIDEIDYLKSLPFNTDEFIDAIRGYSNARAQDEAYARLTFCLLGVVAPGDLIRNPQITPFNVGRPIALADFSRSELDRFAPLLRSLSGDPKLWLDELYRWACGHPYMTQALCQQLCTESAAAALALDPEKRTARAVQLLFLRRGRSTDPNLSYAEKRIDSQADPMRKAELLALYRRLLERQAVQLDNGSPVQQELQLCGMAAPRDDGATMRSLQVRNQIFASTFNLAWVREKETLRKLTRATRVWQDTGRSSDGLLHGFELEEAQSWASEHSSELTQEENYFLRASLDDARREAERRHQKRIVIGLLVVVVMLLALSVALYEQSVKAELSVQAEKSVRAGLLATQPGNQLRALLKGMKVVQQLPRDKLVRQWEGLNRAVEESTLSRILPGHALQLWSASFSADGQRVATTSADRTVRIYDARDGQWLLTLPNQSVGLNNAAFSPDGQRIATGGDDSIARVFDAKSGAVQLLFKAHERPIRSIVFSSDGQRILTASDDRTARIFDAQTGALLLTLTEHSGAVRAAKFSASDQRIVTACDDHAVRVFDGRDGRLLLSLKGHTTSVAAVAFSPDGQKIVSGGDDRTARVFDAQSDAVLFVLSGHSGAIKSVAFSADGKQLATSSDDRTVRIYDASDGRFRFRLLGHTDWISSVAFSPDSQRIVTASYDRTARIWDLGTGRVMVGLQGHANHIRTAVFSADGQRIVTASDDCEAAIWDADTGIRQLVLTGHADSVRGAAFSPNGLRVVTASYDGTARVWDAYTGSSQLVLKGHSDKVRTGVFSADGQRIVTASFDRTARIWDAKSGETLSILTGHEDQLRTAAFSPDGQSIVTSSDDRTARIWSARTGKELRALRGHEDSIYTAAFSPNGQRIVTASLDRTARIWDFKTGREIRMLEEHAAQPRSAAFSPDGQQILTASIDGTARIFDANDGTLLLTLQGPGDSLRFAAFSPNGERVITASDDTPLIHPIQPQEIYRFGCKLLRRLGHYPDVPADEVNSILATCAEPMMPLH